MPFPLTFLVEKNFACPTYRTEPWSRNLIPT